MTTELQKTPLRQVEHVEDLFTNSIARERIKNVAANQLTPEKMLGLLANAVRQTPLLRKCTPMSLLGAVMVAAELGLEPNTQRGLCYLVPFKDFKASKEAKTDVYDVQLIIGYKGYADLAWRTGIVTYMHSDVVYSDDELWSYEHGSNAHLRHKPGPREGAKTHAYFHIKVDAGDGREGQVYVVLPWAEVMKVRNQSQGWQAAVKWGKTESHPWLQHEDRMAAKTAVRRLANSGEMPMSAERLYQAMAVDEADRYDFSHHALTGEGLGSVVDTVVEGDTPVEAPEPAGDVEPPKKAESSPGGQTTRKAESRTSEPTGTAKSGKEADTEQKPPKTEEKTTKAADEGQDRAADERGNDDPGPPPDELTGLVSRLETDLSEVDNAGDIDGLLDLFGQDVEMINAWAPLKERLDAAVDAARERLA